MSLLDDDLIDVQLGEMHHFYKLKRFCTQPLNDAYTNNNQYANILRDYTQKNIGVNYNRSEWDIYNIYNSQCKDYLIRDYIILNSSIGVILINKIMNCPLKYLNDPISFQDHLQFPCTKITIDNSFPNIINIKFFNKRKEVAYFQFEPK